VEVGGGASAAQAWVLGGGSGQAGGVRADRCMARLLPNLTGEGGFIIGPPILMLRISSGQGHLPQQLAGAQEQSYPLLV
jgi:hypothetical protein